MIKSKNFVGKKGWYKLKRAKVIFVFFNMILGQIWEFVNFIVNFYLGLNLRLIMMGFKIFLDYSFYFDLFLVVF